MFGTALQSLDSVLSAMIKNGFVVRLFGSHWLEQSGNVDNVA